MVGSILFGAIVFPAYIGYLISYYILYPIFSLMLYSQFQLFPGELAEAHEWLLLVGLIIPTTWFMVYVGLKIAGVMK